MFLKLLKTFKDWDDLRPTKVLAPGSAGASQPQLSQPSSLSFLYLLIKTELCTVTYLLRQNCIQ